MESLSNFSVDVVSVLIPLMSSDCSNVHCCCFAGRFKGWLSYLDSWAACWCL